MNVFTYILKLSVGFNCPTRKSRQGNVFSRVCLTSGGRSHVTTACHAFGQSQVARRPPPNPDMLKLFTWDPPPPIPQSTWTSPRHSPGSLPQSPTPRRTCSNLFSSCRHSTEISLYCFAFCPSLVDITRNIMLYQKCCTKFYFYYLQNMTLRLHKRTYDSVWHEMVPL